MAEISRRLPFASALGLLLIGLGLLGFGQALLWLSNGGEELVGVYVLAVIGVPCLLMASVALVVHGGWNERHQRAAVRVSGALLVAYAGLLPLIGYLVTPSRWHVTGACVVIPIVVVIAALRQCPVDRLRTDGS